TERGLKNTSRVCERDDAQGPAGAIFAVQDLKAKKIAVFDDGTTGPKGVADEVEKKAKQLGAQPIRYVIRSGDKDFRAILATVPKDVSVIYASLWAPDAALIAKQLSDVGLNVRMIGPDGQFDPVDYIQASGGGALEDVPPRDRRPDEGLRRPPGRARSCAPGRGGRDRRPHRAQRLREDDLLQPHHGSLPGDGRADPVRPRTAGARRSRPPPHHGARHRPHVPEPAPLRSHDGSGECAG